MTELTTLVAVRDAYLYPYTGHTREIYDFQLRRFLGWCEDQELNPREARRVDVERYVQHLLVDRGQAISSVHTAMTPVRGFYRFAYHEGWVERDPAAMARRPRLTNTPRDTLGLDRQQLQGFLRRGELEGGRYYAIAYLTGCMALRASEACSLKIEDYQRTVRGHRVLEFVGKGRVPARMPLPVPVVRAIDAAAHDRTEGRLLLRRDGEPLSRQGLSTLVRGIARRSGVSTPTSPHMVRHSCITNALESGASLRKVQDLARHADPRTTMQYDRNRSNLDDHAVHSLVAFLSSDSSSDGNPPAAL